MPPCPLCNSLTKKDEDDARLAFDFTPQMLIHSAYVENCDTCLVILEGLRQSESQGWSFHRDIRRVYARCLSKRGKLEDTLHLDVWFEDDRPRAELEFYSLLHHREFPILSLFGICDKRERERDVNVDVDVDDESSI